MLIFGFFVIAVAILLTVLKDFGLPLPNGLKGLVGSASFICVMGPVPGGCLIAYGSDTRRMWRYL